MKRALCVLVLAGLRTSAHAESPSLSIDGPDTVATDVTRLRVDDQVLVDQPGATAAFSVDSSIVECSAHGGRVTLIARRAGVTTISIVTGTGIVSFSLTVVAGPRTVNASVVEKEPRTWTALGSQYESATDRVTSSVEMVDGNDRRTYRAYAINVLRMEDDPSNGDSRVALPVLTAEWRTKDREIVVFDKLVEHTPLTIDGATVRGGHLRVDGLELHAGVTSPLLYENVFLSTHAETVLGASYQIGNGRQSLTPSLYAYPSDPQSGGTSGAMGSLFYRYRSAGDKLHLSSELGWGGVVGAAGELTYQDDVNRVWLSARHQPRGFAALGIGRPLGSMLDALWTAQPSKGVTLSAATTAAQYDIGEHTQRVVTALTDVRFTIARHLAASLGMSTGAFDSDTANMTRTVNVPVGLYYERKHGGISAVYRYQQNSARNRGGHGGRLTMRVASGMFHASTYADVQQEAATLAFILKEEPTLAHLLDELGLSASSPDELAQLLREDATLAQLGYSQGATLELNPWRAQAGLDVALISQDAARHQLRLRALADRTQTVGDVRTTTSAMLSYERKLGKQAEMTAMVNWWSRDDGNPAAWSFGAGMRVRFDSLPNLRPWRSHEIEGFVTDANTRSPIANVAISLDRSRTVKTDGRGHFVFAHVSGAPHHVEAVAPEGTYFASRSELTAEVGDTAQFSLVSAASQLRGTITDDVGTGIGSVVVALRGAAVNQTTTTDSLGHYRFAAPAGAYEVTVLAESVPAGFDLSVLRPTTIALGSTPTVANVVLAANRSIAGTVRAGDSTIRIVELDRRAAVDESGNYVFRKLAPGSYTVEVSAKGKIAKRSVDVPVEPASIRGVDFP